LPTRGGFEFEASRLISDDGFGGRPTLFGLQTLPWSTRVVNLGETVNFGAVKAKVVMAALPADDGPELAGQLSKLLGTTLVSTDGFVNLTLGNPGQYIHPGLMYGHFHAWNGEEYTEDTIPMFYAQATDAMGQVVEKLSSDAIAVAQRIEEESRGALDLSDVVPVHDWLESSYSHVTGDVTTVATCLRTGPIQARKAPVTEVSPGRFVPDFGYRYLREDIPYGLVVTRAFGEIADVPTPMIDEVISWAQSKMKKVYLVDGRLKGPDARDLPIPQNHTILTLAELLRWYEGYAASGSRKSQVDLAS
jgi:opine dehydrogenase